MDRLSGRKVMLKKLISVMLFALPMTCLAWGSSGFYVGGGVGADTIDFSNKSYVKQPPAEQKFSVLNETDNAAQGLLGSLFGGYSYVHENFYLAGETNINVSSAAFKTTNSEFDHPAGQATYARMKIIPSWGLSVLPGWLLLQDTALIYARFGYAGGDFHINTTDSSLGNISQVLSGFRYGLGIEKRIYKNIGLRFEYSHIIYQSSTVYKVDASNGLVTPKQTVILPQTNQFELGLVYRFC